MSNNSTLRELRRAYRQLKHENSELRKQVKDLQDRQKKAEGEQKQIEKICSELRGLRMDLAQYALYAGAQTASRSLLLESINYDWYQLHSWG